MNILKEFDEALVREEIKTGKVNRGYRVDGKKDPYMMYLDNNSWEAFKKGMRQGHYDQYDTAGGSELKEKNGRPPKMASFASSSRMIYKHTIKHAKFVDDFIFEKKLTTTVGGMANLDGYLSLPDKHIFVEAKCREPYSHKAEQTIKQNYSCVYEHLIEHMPGIFSCEMTDLPENHSEKPKRNMLVTFYCKGKEVAYFDIKQMICHMLAVATELLKNPDGKDVLFLYFLYNPTGLPLSGDAGKEIQRIYNETYRAATEYDMDTMFGHIVDYLYSTMKNLKVTQTEVAHLKSHFHFMLCDQNDYTDRLK